MSDPYMGEIRLLPYTYAPKNWALCAGQLLGINQNSALFALLGTTYGGNGTSNFALPDLRGRVPIHVDARDGTVLGAMSGSTSHTLSLNELPMHTHSLMASTSDAGSNTALPTASTALGKATLRPSQGMLGKPLYPYSTDTTGLVTMDPFALPAVGGSQAHENRQPYLGMSFCIAINGVYPSRN